MDYYGLLWGFLSDMDNYGNYGNFCQIWIIMGITGISVKKMIIENRPR